MGIKLNLNYNNCLKFILKLNQWKIIFLNNLMSIFKEKI